MSTTELEEYDAPDVPLRREDAAQVIIATPMPNPLGQRIVPTLREVLSWYLDVETGARLRLRKAGFDGLRLPLYVLRSWLYAGHGLWKVWTSWWGLFPVDHHFEHYLIAKMKGDNVGMDKRYPPYQRAWWTRLVLTLALVGGVVGAGWWMWHAHRLWSLLGGAMLLTMLGVMGASSVGRRVRTDFVPQGDIRLRDPNVYVAALQPLCPKDASAVVVGTPHRKDEGWYAEIQVPHGLEIATVVKRKSVVAQGLKVADERLTVDPLRRQSADILGLYVSDHHPLDVTVGSSPVNEARAVDVYGPIPLGMAGQLDVAVTLVGTSVLVAATPGMGKTFVLRNLLNACLLDPAARPAIFDFKGDGDFRPYRKVVDVWHEGDSDETVQAFAEYLRWLRREELPRRSAILSRLVEEEDADSKITRALALDPAMGMPVLPVVIDEGHIPFLFPGEVGRQIKEDLVYVARVGRSKGVTFLFATQRPDSETVPTQLRTVLPTRVVLYCPDGASYDAALGKRPPELLPEEPGVAYASGPGITMGAGIQFRTYSSTVQDAVQVVRRVEAFRSVQPKSMNRPELHLVQDRPQDRPSLPEVLRIALSAWPVAGYDAHADILAGNAGWDRGDLVSAMKDAGVPLKAVYMPRTDGQNTTQRGFKREDIDKARAGYGHP